MGHIIDQNGIRFARDKIAKVLDFVTPVVVNDLMSFMGLVNYFGDHIPHLAEQLKLLREMEAEARKSKRLKWSDERRLQFERIKNIVNELQPLYFLRDGGTIKVYTASDYAIGGYVCQVIDGKEYPVGLVYLNTPPSNKVLRWKLAIQEYDCSIDWIKGELNVVAGGLSRLTDEVPTSADDWSESTNSDEVVQEREVPRRSTDDIEAASRGTVGNGSEPQLPETSRKKTNRKKGVKMNREVKGLGRSVEEVIELQDTSTAVSDGRDQMAVVQRNDGDTDQNVRMLPNETFNPFENARTEPRIQNDEEGRTTTSNAQKPHAETFNNAYN